MLIPSGVNETLTIQAWTGNASNERSRPVLMSSRAIDARGSDGICAVLRDREDVTARGKRERTPWIETAYDSALGPIPQERLALRGRCHENVVGGERDLHLLLPRSKRILALPSCPSARRVEKEQTLPFWERDTVRTGSDTRHDLGAIGRKRRLWCNGPARRVRGTEGQERIRRVFRLATSISCNAERRSVAVATARLRPSGEKLIAPVETGESSCTAPPASIHVCRSTKWTTRAESPVASNRPSGLTAREETSVRDGWIVRNAAGFRCNTERRSPGFRDRPAAGRRRPPEGRSGPGSARPGPARRYVERPPSAPPLRPRIERFELDRAAPVRGSLPRAPRRGRSPFR